MPLNIPAQNTHTHTDTDEEDASLFTFDGGRNVDSSRREIPLLELFVCCENIAFPL